MWAGLCLALILVLCLTGFDLYRPLLIGDAIDLFEQQDNYSIIVNTAIRYAIVLALGFVFNITQTWILQKTGQKIILTIRKELYAHIQSLSSRYFDLTPVGKLVTRVTNDVEALNEMYSGILVNLFRNIIKIAGSRRGYAPSGCTPCPVFLSPSAHCRCPDGCFPAGLPGQPTGLPGQGLRILTLFFPKIFPGCGLSRFLAGKKENMKSLRIKATSFTGRFIGKCWFSPFSAL